MQNGKFALFHTKQKKAGTFYVYYMIAWYYRKNKKPIRNILKHLGKLSQSEIIFYERSVACLNKEPGLIPCNISEVFVRESKEYLSCAVGIHFWDHWQLSSVFKLDHEQKIVKTCDIAKILTVMRHVKACSKSMTAKLFNETCLPELTNISPALYNKTKIFRELEKIEECKEKLGMHIFNMAKKKKYTQGNLLFYDLSSGNITGLKCVMAKWGHCKDGYNTHVVLLLVITPEGYPIYWEVLEGNTADSNTIENLVEKVENIYGKIDSVLCFDRGMVSDDNLKLLENKSIRFITALDGNQVKYFNKEIDFSLIKKVKNLDHKDQFEEVKQKLNQGGYLDATKNLFYQEIQLSPNRKKSIEKLTDKLNLEKGRYYLAFNPELAFLTQKHRKKRICEFVEWIAQYNKELSQALGNRQKETVENKIKNELKKRNIANVEIRYTLSKYKVKNKNKDGKIKEAVSYRINVKKLTKNSYKNAMKYDGIWVLITNLTQINEIEFFRKTQYNSFFEIYRLKNNIEEAFRILSDFVEIEPFYVYKQEHIKAHFTICVLSYLLDITIINKIRSDNKIANMGLHNIFHVLKKCKQDVIQLNEGSVVSKITHTTLTQENILNTLNCAYLISPEYLVDKRIVTI